MSQEGRRRGGHLGGLLLLVAAAVLCRFNLPDRPVSSDLDLSELEKEDWLTQTAGGVLLPLLVKDSVANWRYTDLGVVRIANSERLNARAVGLPFCQWRLYSKEEQE